MFIVKTSKLTDFSSIRQMLEDEGFFLTCKEEDTDCSRGLTVQKTEITRIFQLATMLICVTSVPMNHIADNISYGLCRTLSYVLMAISYALLAVSTPGSPHLQYAWIVHHPAALSLFANSFHLCSLFPKYARILVNTTCGLIAISTMIPQAWLAAVRAGSLTRSEIFYIWLGITIFELVLTFFLFPWHSITDPDFFPNAIDVYKSPMMSLFKPPLRRGSPKQSLILAAKHMQSPVFWSQVLNKVVAQYSVVLTISLANDMMKKSTNSASEYKELQTEYEITRGVTRNVDTCSKLL